MNIQIFLTILFSLISASQLGANYNYLYTLFSSKLKLRYNPMLKECYTHYTN